MLAEVEIVALRLFEQHGFGEVTVDDIAPGSSDSRTFYRYFPSKEDVLQPQIDRRCAGDTLALTTGRTGPALAADRIRGTGRRRGSRLPSGAGSGSSPRHPAWCRGDRRHPDEDPTGHLRILRHDWPAERLLIPTMPAVFGVIRRPNPMVLPRRRPGNDHLGEPACPRDRHRRRSRDLARGRPTGSGTRRPHHPQNRPQAFSQLSSGLVPHPVSHAQRAGPRACRAHKSARTLRSDGYRFHRL